MTFSKDHPDAAKAIKEQLNGHISNVEQDLLKSCACIANERKDKLEEIAKKQEPTPHHNGEYTVQARTFISAVEDSKSNGVNEISELLNHNYEFEMNEMRKKIAKSVLGLLILKNGSEDGSDDPLEFLQKEAGLQD